MTIKHRHLVRQLKRQLAIQDPAQLEQMFAQLQQLSQQASPEVQNFVQALPRFFEQVDQGYQIYERDLKLTQRALELSSSELSGANQQLVQNLEYNQRLKKDLEDREFAINQHAIVSMTDADGNISYVNDRFCTISSYTQAELIGRNHNVLSSGKHTTQYYKEMWDTITAGQRWQGTVCNKGKDGRLYWLSSTIVPFLDEHGEPTQYIAIGTDISDRKALEQDLAYQQRYLQGIVDNMGEGLFAQDAQGRCLLVNKAAERILGWQAHELIGKQLHDVVHYQYPDGRPLPQEECPQREAMKKRVSYQTEDEYYTRRSGEVFPVSLLGVPLFEEGKRIGSVTTFSDITARKNYEQAIILAKEEAEKTSQARSNFLASMSHELRTPMNAIIGFSELLLESDLSREQHKQLSTIHYSAKSLLILLNDILDSAKLESGSITLEQQDFSLRQLSEQVLESLTIEAAKKSLPLRLEYDTNLPMYFRGDAFRLQQILVNLLSNAVKFTHSGEVVLSVSQQHAQVLLEVSDSGIGMTDEQLKTIFEPFVQADSSISRRFGGTGLGMTICKELTELMHGELSVSSQLGHGSRFQVSLPLAVGQAPAANRQPQMVKLPPLRVLAVDDVKSNLELLALILQAQQHQVSVAQSAEAALTLLQQQEFDLILMDLQMPVMDGYACTAAIRALETQQQRRTTPIIALSANVLNEARHKALTTGMNGFANKPIETTKLFAEMARVLGLSADSASALAAASQPAQSINWTQGIELWQSRTRLTAAIHEFLQANTELGTQLKSYYCLHNWQALGQLAHKCAGAAGNLALQPLHKQLKHIETMAASAVEHHAELGTAIAALTPMLEQVSQQLPLPLAATAEKIISAAENKQLISQLESCLKALSRGALPNITLSPYPPYLSQERLHAIQQAIEQFDFNEAQNLLLTTIKALKNTAD